VKSPAPERVMVFDSNWKPGAIPKPREYYDWFNGPGNLHPRFPSSSGDATGYVPLIMGAGR